MITPQQRESYHMALQAWVNAAKEAQRVRDFVFSKPTDVDNMYIMTDQDIYYLQHENEQYQRLAQIVRQL